MIVKFITLPPAPTTMSTLAPEPNPPESDLFAYPPGVYPAPTPTSTSLIIPPLGRVSLSLPVNVIVVIPDTPSSDNS